MPEYYETDEPIDVSKAVLLPPWLAERVLACYYGGAPRYNEPEVPVEMKAPTSPYLSPTERRDPPPALCPVPRFAVTPRGVARGAQQRASS